jgi:hypothetical protein
MTDIPSRTALLVPVPEAEQVVGQHRRALDHTAAWGIPAHVTVLYPFVPPDEIAPAVVAKVQAALDGIPDFTCTFSQVRWFGEQVVWLAPDNDQPFRDLTRTVYDRFPEHPPYRGAILDPVPHLTIGDTHLADLITMRHAADAIQAELPITAKINRVTLMAGTDKPRSWRTLSQFQLGAG